MTIFGVDWEGLELEHLKAFLEAAGDEPLLWEAKGARLDSKEVRRQVCGFANSHDGGYLILGADAIDGGWGLNGVKFPDEPATWISNVVSDLAVGVRPMPDFDVRAWAAPHGHVAVVHITPTSTPPCIANGTVYERISGKTQIVREPMRLAALFKRGDEARRDAEARADRAAEVVLDVWDRQVIPARSDPSCPDPIRFAVGLAATGNPPNIAGRLFRPEFVEHIWTKLRGREPAYGAPEPPSFSQEALVCRHEVVGPSDYSVTVRVSWDGSAGVGQLLTTDRGHPSSLAQSRIRPCLLLAEGFVTQLRGFGDLYLTVIVSGRRFLERGDPVRMRRGPVMVGSSADQTDSLSRELSRAASLAEYEPP